MLIFLARPHEADVDPGLIGRAQAHQLEKAKRVGFGHHDHHPHHNQQLAWKKQRGLPAFAVEIEEQIVKLSGRKKV